MVGYGITETSAGCGFGDTVSQFGTSVSRLALPLLALLVLHASTFEVGLLTAFETRSARVGRLPGRSLRRDIAEGLRFVWVML